MLYAALGSIGFLLMLAYDVMSMKKVRHAYVLFALGAVLTALSAAVITVRRFPDAFSEKPAVTAIAAALAACMLTLLIYTLFFALPKGAYSGEGRLASTGVYALCRHPGAPLFFLTTLMWLISLRSRDALCAFIVWNAAELAYVLIEDAFIFPKTIENYGEYKKTTPMLMPTPASVRDALGKSAE